MRIAFTALFFLSACVELAPVSNTSPQNAQNNQQASSRGIVNTYLQIGKRIEAVAEPMCRRKNPSAPRAYCDFQVKLDSSPANGPNAYQTIGKDGRPVIAFNLPMLQTVRNEHEIAFILGHEAAHQIANHIRKANTNANLGAVILGGIFAASGAAPTTVLEAQNVGGAIGARAYSQTHELEADRLGTYITELAGFSPSIGARSLSRLSGGGGGFLSTHPDRGQRITTVQRTVQQINQDKAAGRAIRIP